MKKLILLLFVSCLTNMAFADGTAVLINPSSDTEVKLEGFFGFQFGYGKQTNLSGPSQNVTDNKKKVAFYTEAAFSLTVKQAMENFTAGAKIVLLPTTKPKTSASYNGSNIFLETEYGKVELGSPYDAGANMRITGYKAAAVGSSWNRYIVLNDINMRYLGIAPDFDSSDNFYTESFVNGFDDMTSKTEAARKVSYYTPKIEGFQFGISYTPDSANTGGNRKLNNLVQYGNYTYTKSSTGVTIIPLRLAGWVPGDAETNNEIILNQNVINAISSGISYEHQFLNDVAIQVAVTGEFGKPARPIIWWDNKTKVVTSTSKLSGLKAYNIGGFLSYGNFSCSASYGSLGKSLTSPDYHKVGRVTEYYNGAVAYGQGPIKTSLSYFKSSRYKSTIDTVSLATEYKVMPGLLPYAEIALFRAKGKPVYYPEAPNKKTNGGIAVLGAKVKF